MSAATRWLGSYSGSAAPHRRAVAQPGAARDDVRPGLRASEAIGFELWDVDLEAGSCALSARAPEASSRSAPSEAIEDLNEIPRQGQAAPGRSTRPPRCSSTCAATSCRIRALRDRPGPRPQSGSGSGSGGARCARSRPHLLAGGGDLRSTSGDAGTPTSGTPQVYTHLSTERCATCTSTRVPRAQIKRHLADLIGPMGLQHLDDAPTFDRDLDASTSHWTLLGRATQYVNVGCAGSSYGRSLDRPARAHRRGEEILFILTQTRISSHFVHAAEVRTSRITWFRRLPEARARSTVDPDRPPQRFGRTGRLHSRLGMSLVGTRPSRAPFRVSSTPTNARFVREQSFGPLKLPTNPPRPTVANVDDLEPIASSTARRPGRGAGSVVPPFQHHTGRARGRQPGTASGTQPCRSVGGDLRDPRQRRRARARRQADFPCPGVTSSGVRPTSVSHMFRAGDEASPTSPTAPATGGHLLLPALEQDRLPGRWSNTHAGEAGLLGRRGLTVARGGRWRALPRV